MSRPDKLNIIKGTMFGGAIGDALGYPVEFKSEVEICEEFGSNGISDLKIDESSKVALVSDDTQMSLFTANGLLVALTKNRSSSEVNLPACVAASYEDWLATQMRSYDDIHEPERRDPSSKFYHMDNSWILDVPQLYSSREPGGTCIYGLIDRVKGGPLESYIAHPINTSKGCGGIMRVAPVALYTSTKSAKEITLEAAEIAAITHTHSLGYMPSAMLANIIYNIAHNDSDKPLKDIVIESKETINQLFEGDEYLQELNDIVDLAITLSENTNDDITNIHELGEGWVAEETLGIALYCALKYQNDFSKGTIAAVNHNGDSDSTGAVTGNILGAWLGFEKINPSWLENLELRNVINELSKDLSIADKVDIKDPCWNKKYIEMTMDIK